MLTITYSITRACEVQLGDFLVSRHNRWRQMPIITVDNE